MVGNRRPQVIAEVLDHVLRTDPGRIALVAPSGRLSYEALDQQIDAAAAALRALGVGPADRVAACLPNDLDIVVAFHATMRLGAVWVGINQALVNRERLELLAAAAPVVTLADQTIDGAEKSTRLLEVGAGRPTEWADACRAHRGASRCGPVDARAAAAIAFTSGTTGRPKGVVHSQHNLLLPAAALVESRRWDRSLVKGDCLPLTILNLQILTTLVTAQAGGRAVISDHRYAPAVADWIVREGVNVWNGVPALLHSMVHDEAIASDSLAGLEEVWTGGAGCPDTLAGQFGAKFGLSLRHTYGLTEAPSVVSIDPVGSAHVPGGSGVPLPHLRVVTRDDDGEELPEGQIGEIVVRARTSGPWAGEYRPPLGSWKQGGIEPNGAEELLTGDIGRVDSQGFVHVVDRKKLLIIRGGANVYPAEVERVIDRLAGVTGSAVVGVADERLGQRVVAAVEADPLRGPSPEEVVDACRRALARYKVPERVVVVSRLQRNAMAKIDRSALPALFSD